MIESRVRKRLRRESREMTLVKDFVIKRSKQMGQYLERNVT